MIPQIKTIVYATDLGQHTRPAFRHAIAVAEKFGARIVVVHVLEPLGTTAQTIIESYVPQEQLAQIRKEGISRTRDTMTGRIELACEEELGVSAKDSDLIEAIVVRQGLTADEVYDEARSRDAQLIVIGSHSHSTLGELLIGSAARKLTQISKIPVLLVPIESD